MRVASNFAVAVILASCCVKVLASRPDKTQPPTSVDGKGPVASVKLIRKTNLKEESIRPSFPLKGPDWIEQKGGAISSEFSIASSNNEFSLKLTESPENEGDIAVYNAALKWEGHDELIPLGLATGAVISPDSHYIILEPLRLIDVVQWRMYDLRKAFQLNEGYFGVDRWSKTENKFVVHVVQCPFDCPPGELIEYWLVELRHTTAIDLVNYFPTIGLLKNEGVEQFKSDWYSNQLTALQEPSLWETSRTLKTESYRFLWLRSFHHPIAIRVDVNPDGTARLTTKVASGAGGYDPGEVTQNRTVTMNLEETNQFLGQVQNHNFWKLPSVEEAPGGPDGARWILEGVKTQTYHVVDRWSPQDGDVRAIGLFMVNELAKIKPPDKDVY